MNAAVRNLLDPWVGGNLARAESLLRGMLPDLSRTELVTLSRDKVPGVRASALQLAASIAPDLGDDLALVLLNDAVEFVRWTAAEKLFFNRCYCAAGPLANLLVREPDELVRNMAVCALGCLGNEDHLPHLRAALAVETGRDHEDSPIQDHIVRSIEAIESRRTPGGGVDSRA